MPVGGAEDGNTPKEVYNWRIYTIAIMACMGACMFGYNLGVIGGCIVLPEFHREFRLPDTNTTEYNFITANIISCMQGGTFFGSILALPLTEKYGRVPIMGLAGVVFTAGSAMQTFAAGSLNLMYSGRLVGGLGLGISSFLVPLYLAELSPPSIRGFIVGMHEILNQISGISGFWVNYGTLHFSGNKQWMIPLGVQMAPGALLFLACLLLPESPRFLVRNGRIEDAGKNLGWIRGFGKDWRTNENISEVGREYVSKELGDMILQIENERKEIAAGKAQRRTGDKSWTKLIGLRGIFRPGDLRRLGVGVGLMVCQQLTGVNAMNYYSPAIFKSIGFTGTNVGLFASGIYAIVKTVVTLTALAFFIDRTGRRKLLMIGAFGGSMAMWYLGGYITAVKLDPAQPGSKSAAGWVAIVCVYLYAASFSIAWNGIPWIYCSEIFPGRIRSLCVSITTATQWLWQFVISRATPYMLSDLHGGMYFFFAACMFVTVGWVYLFVPETKGRTLESMDELFGHKNRAVEGPSENMREGGAFHAANEEKAENEGEVGAVVS